MDRFEVLGVRERLFPVLLLHRLEANLTYLTCFEEAEIGWRHHITTGKKTTSNKFTYHKRCERIRREGKTIFFYMMQIIRIRKSSTYSSSRVSVSSSMRQNSRHARSDGVWLRTVTVVMKVSFGTLPVPPVMVSLDGNAKKRKEISSDIIIS